MGVSIKNILDYDIIKIESLANKKITIDTFNMIYQFLASIRQPNGEPLKDSLGNVTSHLKGLFNRLVYFKKNNIKAIFVFDGIPPKLKEKTRNLRSEIKQKAQENLEIAKEKGDEEEMLKFSRAINYLDTKMINECKKLIELFGFPIINAPSEGEAQSSFLTNENKIFASSSQDFDSLLFGSKYLIRNLSIGGKRRVPRTSIYRNVDIEFYDLRKILKNLDISQDELIIVGILVGTDYNPGGIKGIGPKKALNLVKEYKDKWDFMFKNLRWYDYFLFSWQDVYSTFKNIPVEKNCDIKFSEIKKDKIKEFLLNFDFDEVQVSNSLNKIKIIKSLDNFFNFLFL
jgi:flap endonuclease-1